MSMLQRMAFNLLMRGSAAAGRKAGVAIGTAMANRKIQKTSSLAESTLSPAPPQKTVEMQTNKDVAHLQAPESESILLSKAMKEYAPVRGRYLS